MEKTLNLILEKLNSMESDIKELKQGQTRLEQGQQEIKHHLIQLDSQNADRHINAFSKLESIDIEQKKMYLISKII